MSVSMGDFQPMNTWKLDLRGKKYDCCPDHRGQPKFLIDQTTHRRYSNESKEIVGFKCFLLTLGTPFVHSIASIVNVGYRILKLATLSHFWAEKNEKPKYNFKARLADAGRDLLRTVATPFSILGLELAAIYGMVRPYDGRKLYASIERGTYGHFILAPCFQPNPKYHALGGSIHEKDAF